MLLTDNERKRFAEYLERTALDADGMAKQLDSMKSPPMIEMAKRERTYAAAAFLIAKRLRQTESQAIAATPDQE